MRIRFELLGLPRWKGILFLPNGHMAQWLLSFCSSGLAMGHLSFFMARWPTPVSPLGSSLLHRCPKVHLVECISITYGSTHLFQHDGLAIIHICLEASSPISGPTCTVRGIFHTPKSSPALPLLLTRAPADAPFNPNT